MKVRTFNNNGDLSTISVLAKDVYVQMILYYN